MLGADECERLLDPRPDLGRLGADVLEPERDLVRDPRHHDLVLGVLEDRRDGSRELRRARLARVDAADDDATREDAPVEVRHEPRERTQQRRLAGARRPEHETCSPSASSSDRSSSAGGRPGAYLKSDARRRLQPYGPHDHERDGGDDRDAVDGAPCGSRRTCVPAASVPARLHRLCEVEAPLERAGEQRREQPRAAELDVPAAKRDDAAPRVPLEQGDEPRRERGRERRSARPAGGGEQPVVVDAEARRRRTRARPRPGAGPGTGRCGAPRG